MNERGHEDEKQDAAPDLTPIAGEQEEPHPAIARAEPRNDEPRAPNDSDETERALIQALQRSTNRSNWVIAVATIVIMLATGIQTWQVIESNRITRQAAADTVERMDAANIAARESAAAALEEDARQFEEQQKQAVIDAEAERDLLRESLARDRENLATTLQARLVPLSARFVEGLDDPELKTVVVWTNSGSTPAKDVTCRVLSLAWGTKVKEIAPDMKVIHFANRFAPGGSYDMTSSWAKPNPIPSEAIERLKTGEIGLRIRGWCEYGDDFAAKRPEEPFCFEWHAKRSTFTICREE